MKQKGFTLIELLVVIAVIGLLASIILVALNNSRTKARDARRLADLQSLSTALDLFYDKYGSYPCGKLAGGSVSYDSSFQLSDANYPFLSGDLPGGICMGPAPNGTAEGLIWAGILNAQIKDPINDANFGYTYEVDYQTSERQQYILYTRLENNTSLMQNDGGKCRNLYEFGSGVGVMTPKNTYTLGMETCIP